ncbi:hypothetical protein [Streptomyces niveus]|uniref:hypothetical protein n=1 Tax=Streptomyces niveus TaxID=193462 RepID=UPI00343F4755
MELAGRGTYERRLAAFAALVGRQLDFLAERLTDRDPVVRAYALRAARTLPLPDAAIEAAYEDAPADARQRLSAVVLASGRTALAERLVPRLRERWGDHAAAKLLPVCSARFVAATLPELSYAVESWTKLGLGFPDQVLDHVEREIADRPGPPGRPHHRPPLRSPDHRHGPPPWRAAGANWQRATAAARGRRPVLGARASPGHSGSAR